MSRIENIYTTIAGGYSEWDGPPQSREEEILFAIRDGTNYDKLPQSRIEKLLLDLKDSGLGGGSSVQLCARYIMPIYGTVQTMKKVDDI